MIFFVHCVCRDFGKSSNFFLNGEFSLSYTDIRRSKNFIQKCTYYLLNLFWFFSAFFQTSKEKPDWNLYINLPDRRGGTHGNSP